MVRIILVGEVENLSVRYVGKNFPTMETHDAQSVIPSHCRANPILVGAEVNHLKYIPLDGIKHLKNKLDIEMGMCAKFVEFQKQSVTQNYTSIT